MSTPSEDELIRNAKEGDLESFGKLVEMFRDAIFSRASGVLRKGLSHLADDVAQKAFLIAFQKIQGFENRGEVSFLSWVSVIAMNLAKERNKREPNGQVHEDEAAVGLDHAGLSHVFQGDEVSPLLERVISAIEKLDYDCRILLLATYAYGIAPIQMARVSVGMMEEGAREVGMTDGVWSRIKGILDPLKNEMTDRRNYCFKKLTKAVQRKGHAESKAGTKKDSRNSAK